MDVFIKSFSNFRTLSKLPVLSHSIVVDSLDAEKSTIVVSGASVTRENTGDWLVIDGTVFWISVVTPQIGRTQLTLLPPLEAFARSIELDLQVPDPHVGGFIRNAIVGNWVECPDAAYAAPYLVVSNSDTTAYVAPEVDNKGCFSLAAYCRLMRKSYRITVSFSVVGQTLRCDICRLPERSRQISFEDGRSQLQKTAFSASGIAKLTVLCDTDTGEKGEDGAPIIVRSRSTWYLSESGEITQTVPAQRAAGDWATISVKGSDDVFAKVVEAFAKNKSNHKLEFWSVLDLNVQDTCTFFVYGQLLTSYISYKQKSGNDKRYYYKSGELATTATEKLRGVTK